MCELPYAAKLTFGHVEPWKIKITIPNPAFSISCITNHTCNQVTNKSKMDYWFVKIAEARHSCKEKSYAAAKCEGTKEVATHQAPPLEHMMSMHLTPNYWPSVQWNCHHSDDAAIPEV